MTQHLATELRIYTGIHAGARAVLTSGSHVLGADPSCDFILCDAGVAGRHAELRISDGVWMLHPLSTGEEIPSGGMRLAAGAGVAMGSVVIGMDAVNAPWQAPDLVSSPTAVADTENVPESNMPGILVEPLPSPPPPAVEIRAASNRRFGWYLWPGLAAFAVLVLVLILMILMQADEPLIPATPSASASPHAQVLAIIDSLNLTQRARVDRRPDGNLAIKAALLTDDEYERFAAALSQINPRPELKVTGEQELIKEVHDALAARGTALSADYLGAGRFQINGKIAGEAERDALLRALATEVPTALGFESALLTPDMIAKKLLGALSENGATEVSGQWQDETFIVKAKVPGGDLRRWELALIDTDERIGKWLAFNIRVELDGTAEASLPFRIQGVVGGLTPFVVLADRSKVLLGGRAHGWRLTEIDGDHVVFDGPRRVAVRR